MLGSGISAPIEQPYGLPDCMSHEPQASYACIHIFLWVIVHIPGILNLCPLLVASLCILSGAAMYSSRYFSEHLKARLKTLVILTLPAVPS